MGEKSSRAYQVFVNMEYTTEHVQISKGSFQLNNYNGGIRCRRKVCLCKG